MVNFLCAIAAALLGAGAAEQSGTVATQTSAPGGAPGGVAARAPAAANITGTARGGRRLRHRQMQAEDWVPVCAAVVDIPAGVTTIPMYAFRDCTIMTAVTIPDSVLAIQYGAFPQQTGKPGAASLATVVISANVESIGYAAFGTAATVCVDTDQAVAPNLPWVPTCNQCAEGTALPLFYLLDSTSESAPGCTPCPFPERCPGGTTCAPGARDLGCADCRDGWFAFGGGCSECPEGIGLEAPIALSAALGTGIIARVWKLAGRAENAEDLEGMRGGAVTARGVQGQVNNAVAFVGITAFHLQLSAINLDLPGFPYPRVLRTIARWIENVIGFDFGTVASPECQSPGESAYGVLKFKTFFVNAVFVAVMMALWLIGKGTGRRNQARNAMLAMFTLMLAALVKANTRWIDCTDGTMDPVPGMECKPGVRGVGGVAVFCVLMPLVLWWALRRDGKLPFCLCCGRCFDSPGKGEPFSRGASYAWVSDKYSPSHQQFEVAFIAYKVATVFTCSKYLPANRCCCFPENSPYVLCAKKPFVVVQSCSTAQTTRGSCWGCSLLSTWPFSLWSSSKSRSATPKVTPAGRWATRARWLCRWPYWRSMRWRRCAWCSAQTFLFPWKALSSWSASSLSASRSFTCACSPWGATCWDACSPPRRRRLRTRMPQRTR